MTEATAHLEYRLRILPTQLARARERYRHLLAEATQYRMADLLAEEAQLMAQPLVPASAGTARRQSPPAAASTLFVEQEAR
jgi:hypothetical protein